MSSQGFGRLEDDHDAIVTRDSHHTSQRGEPGSIRARLDVLIHSHNFNVAVMILVGLDCLMVIAELLFDLEIVEVGEDLEYVPHIFHYSSLAILSVFMVEVSIRIYVLRIEFLSHKLEVLDAVIVVVSWVLDIIFRDSSDATVGVGLLVMLRLWRVTRIINNIILSAQKQADSKVEKEKELRQASEEQLERFIEYSTALETRVAGLEEVLKDHDVDFSSVPEVTVEKPEVKVIEPESKSSRKAEVEGAVVELNTIAVELNQMSEVSKT